MKEARYELLNEETRNISRLFENLDSYFELTTNDLNKITLMIHLPGDTACFSAYLDSSLEDFVQFQYFLIYDFLVYSQLKHDELQIDKSLLEKQIEFQIKSENGFNIVSDSY